MSTPDQSFKSLLKELVDDIGRLTRQELRLAQAEASEKVTQIQTGVISIVAGLLLALSALLILLQALVIALSNVLAPWLAAIVVAVGVAIVALILVKQGQSNLKATSLAPSRTLNSLQSDKELVREKVT